jgi:hypothetical protein
MTKETTIDVKSLQPIGEVQAQVVKLNDTFNFESTLPSNVFFELSMVYLPDAEAIAFPEPRRFVPSFDKSKSDSVWLLTWSNKEEVGQEVVVVNVEVDTNLGTITSTGCGYESVLINIWEYKTPKEETPTDKE